MSRVALVTGGTRGIGAAISIALGQAGYRVAATYAGNDAAADAFKAEHGIPVFKWDVGDFDACAQGIAAVARDIGPIEVLVNNAGVTRDDGSAKSSTKSLRNRHHVTVGIGGCEVGCQAPGELRFYGHRGIVDP